jgi:hypothetical protein
MEPEGSLPRSQQPATCPCPEPDQSNFLKVLLILTSNLNLGLPDDLFPLGFPIKTLYIPSLYPLRATYPANLILFNLIAQIIFGDEYRS